ncbi:hypothetical protein CSOJ01_02342 [Colletotrichum sojae]|uniref:Uncharacterized protein n=1 Tax=Colletotrichum sojae TaxID=2175907 RepID=A0A8H6JQS1_9PEZI|nr:hypothetical protein CSOJ01_02342 [Colletotrichum sojae]
MPNPAAYLHLGACVGRQPSCKLFVSHCSRDTAWAPSIYRAAALRLVLTARQRQPYVTSLWHATSAALTVHTTGTPAAVTAGLGQTLHENTDGGGGVAILIARLEIRNPDDGPTMVQHNDGPPL